MTESGACGHCGGSLSTGARFCPSCGILISRGAVNWLERLCAAMLDISIFVGCTALLIWLGMKWWIAFPVWLVLTEIGYQLKGGIGKSFMGLSVPITSRSQYYLRETIGKLASVATFGIGFLMVFSKERLALHDHMSKTAVLRVGGIPRIRTAIVSVAVIFGLSSLAYLVLRTNKTDRSIPSSAQTEPTSLTTITSQLPAVATIYVYDSRGKPVGQGSGFLINADGLCVTNFHVIQDAFSADIKLGDGRLYHLLSVSAYDMEHDLAIVQLGRKTSSGIEEAKELPFLRLATDKAQIGDRIATVGSPEGLSNSVADGLVSAIRNEDGSQFLQISAPISPGSSGGPVFNFKGEVVGISSFQLKEGQNLNFAIPVDEITRLRGQSANLSLEQVFRQTHLSDISGAAAKSKVRDTGRSEERSAALAPLKGSFVGTVHNLTVDSTANFEILIQENQGQILGCMGVHKPLYGSGPLLGSVSGPDVQFNIDSEGIHIEFVGRRNGNKLSGAYRALPKGGTAQQGEFSLEKEDSKGPPKNFEPERDCPTDAEMNR
jgi:S1-C subfamily serine protease